MVRRRSRFIGVYRPVRSFPGSSLLIVNQRLVIHWLIVEGTSSRASVLLRANGDIETRAAGVNCFLPSIIINPVVRWSLLTRHNAGGSRRPKEVEWEIPRDSGPRWWKWEDDGDRRWFHDFQQKVTWCYFEKIDLVPLNYICIYRVVRRGTLIILCCCRT